MGGDGGVENGSVRYPVFVELAGRRVVVVGGGAVAVRRLTDLLAAGADVTVIAPSYDPAIAGLDVTIEHREFAPADVDGAVLVLACTDSSRVNAAVAAAAERRGIWCIRADDASRSRAWRPASAQIDDVTIAVSAAGDPTRAAGLRDAIESQLRNGQLGGRRVRRGEDSGRVVLVGGGPGDPDLLTLRGYRALLAADVVVTDRLGPTGLLELLPPDVEVIDVGKTPGGHSAEQQAINQLIIDRAGRGDLVVRLKGGDPFVLGRGSEEVDACLEAGIAVEVVPGLTSAVSAATLAGIPLTERGTTQHFTVVSGHVPPGDDRSSVDWALLAATDATLVMLMAVANLRAIAAALIAGGREASTPAAIVENASLPQQRVITATLGELADVADAQAVVPPAVVIVGDVVRLSD
ncbi:MAG: uroporphyrinogen-III C-methyltransferase [Frankiaceae bacterium]|nr:uroporphyrinogen-III C-methyltransferase [Frankiaceae bacterium]